LTQKISFQVFLKTSGLFGKMRMLHFKFSLPGIPIDRYNCLLGIYTDKKAPFVYYICIDHKQIAHHNQQS
jgi:hypothetical protein